MADLVYSPPGVYVAEDPSPVPNISTVVAIPPARVAIVGPSVGYQTTTETIRLIGTTPVTLAQTGVDTTTVVVKSLAGATYVNADDYDLAEVGANPEEAVTTITRDAGGDIGNDEVVYVTYQYTNSAYFLPFLTSDFDEIQTRYGPAFNPSTGAIGSPLSLAAKIVMEQGAREIILVPTRGSSITAVTAAQINSAYASLEARDDVGLLVPLGIGITGTDVSPGDTTNLVTNAQVHATNMAAVGKYRVAVIGFDTGVTRDHAALAINTASNRVILAYPNILSYYNGYTNTTIELGGPYLAAAFAGMMASRQPQEPLTQKVVASFNSIPARIFTTMTASAKDAMSQAGVSVAELLTNGQIRVRHGVTTDRSSVFRKEISIVRAKDTLINLAYQALSQAGIIGSPMTNETPVRVRSIMDGALLQAVNSGVIIRYNNLAARQDASDPTRILVKFSYVPVYPLNRIDVSFSINTQTGTLQEAA